MMSSTGTQRTVERARFQKREGFNDSLRDVVKRELRSSNYPPLWNLDCEVVDGSVILFGVVPSYYMKQVAQTVVMKIDEAKCVDNRVEVCCE